MSSPFLKVNIMARKKTEEVKKEPVKKKKAEVPEAVYIYHTGDDLEKISKLLTGKGYMIYAILSYSGLTMNSLKDGDILKWGL